MPRYAVSAKRRRGLAEPSQDLTTAPPNDVTRATKEALLKKARKRVRKIPAHAGEDAESCASTKSHCAATGKSCDLRNGCEDPAMATSISSGHCLESEEVKVVELEGTDGKCTAEETISHADLMEKLCEVTEQLVQLNVTVQDLRGEMFTLKVENEELKAELGRCRQQQEQTGEMVKEAKFEASVAHKKINDLEQYTRRNNVRVLGLPETQGESVEECEQKVLKIINGNLKLPNVKSADIEAVHRIGRRDRQGRGQPAKPRQVIVRFLSRKMSEAVLGSRRRLKNSGIVIVEDLTHDTFCLLHKCRDHPGVADAWTRRGNIYLKTKRDSQIIRVTKAADLQLVPEVPTPTPIPQIQRRRRGSPLHLDHSPMASSGTAGAGKGPARGATS